MSDNDSLEQTDNVVLFKLKKEKVVELVPGADSPNQVWECPCGSQTFNLRADYQVECSKCDTISHFKYYDLRLL
jgi:hypothetical protein